MDKLKEILGDLYEQVAAKLGTTKVLIDDGTYVKKGDDWIPKHRFDEVVAEKKALDERAKKADDDLKDLKGKAAGNDALTQQITALQAQNAQTKADAEKAIQLMRKSTSVNEALLNAGVVDPAARTLLAKSLDIEKLELDETGKPKGFDETIKPLKENKSFAGMFGQTVIQGQEHAGGGSPAPGEFYTRDEVTAMTQQEVTANLEKVNKSMSQWK
jgi:hypothetical protein